MKKQYEQPKAEKLEFDYEETIVASGFKVDNNPNGRGCQVNEEGYNWKVGKGCVKL